LISYGRSITNKKKGESSDCASPQYFGAMIKVEVRKWGKVVRDAGIKPD